MHYLFTLLIVNTVIVNIANISIGQNDIPSLQIQLVEYIQDKNLIKELESFLRKEVHSYTIIP